MNDVDTKAFDEDGPYYPGRGVNRFLSVDDVHCNIILRYGILSELLRYEIVAMRTRVVEHCLVSDNGPHI